jgi:Tfp pilus assembly protein PilO
MTTKKNMVAILAVGALALIGGLYYLSTLVAQAGDAWPYEGEPGSLIATIGGLQGDIGRERENVAKIPAAQETLDKLKVDYDLAVRVLPRENSPDQLLAAIRTKAQQVGITPDQIVPSANPGGGGGGGRGGRGGSGTNFEEWSFSLSITGSYDQISSFVNRMEEFESSDAARVGSEKRFFRVVDIDITAQDNGMGFIGSDSGASSSRAGQARHTCKLVMRTYRYIGAE